VESKREVQLLPKSQRKQIYKVGTEQKKERPLKGLSKSRGGETRTHDPQHPMLVRYQLRYTPILFPPGGEHFTVSNVLAGVQM
jgi:hypothetical protein